MGSSWADGWVSATLDDAGLPITDFTRRSIKAWQQSTPILPYTNNPLGLAYVKGVTGQLLRTGYAMYPTMAVFRASFAQLVNSPAWRQLHDALALGEKYSQVWRAVSALRLPASQTETDYPSAVLDLTSEAYRKSATKTAEPSQRKTSGQYGTQTAFGSVAGAISRDSANAFTRLQQAAKAAREMPGRMR